MHANGIIQGCLVTCKITFTRFPNVLSLLISTFIYLYSLCNYVNCVQYIQYIHFLSYYTIAHVRENIHCIVTLIYKRVFYKIEKKVISWLQYIWASFANEAVLSYAEWSISTTCTCIYIAYTFYAERRFAQPTRRRELSLFTHKRPTLISLQQSQTILVGGRQPRA